MSAHSGEKQPIRDHDKQQVAEASIAVPEEQSGEDVPVDPMRRLPLSSSSNTRPLPTVPSPPTPTTTEEQPEPKAAPRFKKAWLALGVATCVLLGVTASLFLGDSSPKPTADDSLQPTGGILADAGNHSLDANSSGESAENRVDVDPAVDPRDATKNHDDLSVANDLDNDDDPNTDVARRTGTQLNYADTAFTRGDYRTAIRVYETLIEQLPPPEVALVEFRLGLCLEALGDHAAALTTFRHVVESTRDRTVTRQAKLAQARVWTKVGKGSLAEALLADLLLTVDGGEAASSEKADIMHLLGNSLARSSQTTAALDPLKGHTVATAALNWNHTHLLRHALIVQSSVLNSPVSLSSADESTAEEPAALTSGVRVIEPAGSVPDAVYVEVSLDATSLEQTIAQLATAANWRVTWTPSTRNMAVTRFVTIHRHELNAAVALDALLLPHGFRWEFNEGVVEVSQQSSAKTAASPSPGSPSARRRATARLLKQAIYQFPDHPWAATSLLQLANLDFASQDFTAAMSVYEKLQRQFPRSRILAECFFNLAKAQLVLGQPVKSRTSFERAIDHGRGHPLEATAYLYVGRLYLEDDQPSRAIRPLRRAVAFASHETIRVEALLMLSSAYLLNDNRQGANLVLFEQRRSLPDDARDRAALLASLARYRSTNDPSRKTHEGRTVIEALSHVTPADFFGHYGSWLLAEAYDEIGLSAAMADCLTSGLEAPYQYALQDRMALRLAAHATSVGQHETAVALFDRLATHGQSAHRTAYRVQATEARVKHLPGDDATKTNLHRYRDALKTTEDNEARKAILKMMADQYESQGQYAKAVQCLSGLVPKEDAP